VAVLAARTDHAATIPEIAEATHVSPPYLRKVMNRLRDAGIVHTQRGTGGGISLAQDPFELTILDVVNAVGRVAPIERCPLGLRDHTKLCPLHTQLSETIAQMEKTLTSRTIGELVSKNQTDKSRCDFPRIAECYQL